MQLIYFAWATLTLAYTPEEATCPSGALVRNASGLSTGEQDYVTARLANVKPALESWLEASSLEDFDVDSFMAQGTPKIALAFSGGGYRAMLTGAGELAALDSRTDGATGKNHLGGLLQSSTYISGLSGGNWLLTSVVQNGFPTISSLQGSSDEWNLAHSMLDPHSWWDVSGLASYWRSLVSDVRGKQAAGFKISLTDIYARGLSWQLYKNTDGNHAGTINWSDMRSSSVYTEATMPYPVVVCCGREPNTYIVSTNSTIFEISPLEIGSWDPTLGAFIDPKWLGSTVDNGESTGKCYNGFDNIGFITGTSSSVFNSVFINFIESLPKWVQSVVQSIASTFGTDNWDIAVYSPNPFLNFGNTNKLTSSTELTLVDGGEDGQNVPIAPWLVPEREVDVVFAFDSSADTSSSSPLGADFPDGSALVSTYQRQFSEQGLYKFPDVPDTTTFVYGGFVEQPTFFGCNNTATPLIVYMANQQHSYASNEATLKLSYSTDEMAGMITNGYNIATQNNGTIDSEWRSCVACAVVLRQQQRNGVTPSEQCQACFSEYCYTGETVTASSGTAGRRDGKSNLV